MAGDEPGIERGAGPDPEGYAHELSELRRVLEEAPVVGRPRREAELAELQRLIQRYPREARELLRQEEAGE